MSGETAHSVDSAPEGSAIKSDRPWLKRFGLDAPTWTEPTCFYFDTAEEAWASILRVYGANAPHHVVELVHHDTRTCDGSGDCPATLHTHGMCFADRDGARCDHPRGHDYRLTTPAPTGPEEGRCVACGESADEGPVASNGDRWCGECYREATP